MEANSRPESEGDQFELVLDSGHLPVSYISSLLRVLQAAVREVARADDQVRARFEERPQPVMVLSRVVCNGDLVVSFTFVDPLDGRPLGELARKAFGAFVREFGKFLNEESQRGFWDDTVRVSRRRRHASDVARRMGQVHLELRRFSRATVRLGAASVHMEGDRLDVA